MCQECTSGEHGEHPTVPLKDVVEQHKASLQDQLDAVKKRCDTNAHVIIAQTLEPSSRRDSRRGPLWLSMCLAITVADSDLHSLESSFHY